MTDWLYRNVSMSLPGSDISDIYYDAFLANGKPADMLAANPGETVRVRIVNASASSYYYIQFAGTEGKMRIVAADGQDVEPVEVDRFLIAIAETYDIVVEVPDPGSYELRATAQDILLCSSARATRFWLLMSPTQKSISASISANYRRRMSPAAR